MNELDFNDDDVVFVNHEYTNAGSSLLMWGWLKASFKTRFGSSFDQWSGEGIEGKVLQANGSGWRKGKFRWRLEFIPDEPEQTSEPTPGSSDAVRSPQ